MGLSSVAGALVNDNTLMEMMAGMQKRRARFLACRRTAIFSGQALCVIPRIFAGCLLLGVGLAAHASGGAATYPLDWPHVGEVLTYRACGCADACWVAEVRLLRTKALKARLRCDCETLRYQQSSAGSEEKALGGCEPINGSERKSDAIRERLEQLLHSSRQEPSRPAHRPASP
ncbi:hypothetical protein M5C99_15965 [Acidovorax sp. NCPPB 2350]|nr:hypothetical protein M5C99_15965 [Acidovorax sp. NCPPB 2350]